MVEDMFYNLINLGIEIGFNILYLFWKCIMYMFCVVLMLNLFL